MNKKYFSNIFPEIFECCALSEPQLSSQSEKGPAVMRGKRRKKNLIGTEFSPSEWNINNINKYKK